MVALFRRAGAGPVPAGDIAAINTVVSLYILPAHPAPGLSGRFAHCRHYRDTPDGARDGAGLHSPGFGAGLFPEPLLGYGLAGGRDPAGLKNQRPPLSRTSGTSAQPQLIISSKYPIWP